MFPFDDLIMWPTRGFVEVDIDALKLEVWVAAIGSGGVDTMFVWDHLPELQGIRT